MKNQYGGCTVMVVHICTFSRISMIFSKDLDGRYPNPISQHQNLLDYHFFAEIIQFGYSKSMKIYPSKKYWFGVGSLFVSNKLLLVNKNTVLQENLMDWYYSGVVDFNRCPDYRLSRVCGKNEVLEIWLIEWNLWTNN